MVISVQPMTKMAAKSHGLCATTPACTGPCSSKWPYGNLPHSHRAYHASSTSAVSRPSSMASGLEQERALNCIFVLDVYVSQAVLLGVPPVLGRLTDVSRGAGYGREQ